MLLLCGGSSEANPTVTTATTAAVATGISTPTMAAVHIGLCGESKAPCALCRACLPWVLVCLAGDVLRLLGRLTTSG